MPATAEVKVLHPSHQSQVQTHLDCELGVYWAYMEPRSRPCFSLPLLDDLRRFISQVKDSSSGAGRDGGSVSYAVLASKIPGIFNLGGDLGLFRVLIDAQDRESLVRYGEKCVDNLFEWHRNCETNVTTFALVQGDALGGGFEAALSATVLVAEESSRMGFPEILFNLFPGMGAFSFLSRKIGRRAAEEMITSGSIYSARQLYDMGVVDVLTPDGTGEAAVNGYIRKHSKSKSGRQGFERARNAVTPVTREELMDVVHVWADTAMRLQDRDLKVMDRLIRAQYARSGAPADDAPVRASASLRAVGGND